jgi:DNA-binding Lrp family transcriptional regulator
MTDDELDAAILDILMDDGRTSGSELVRRLDAPPSRVRARLAWVLASDEVHVTALLNPALIGRPIVAMLRISATDPAPIPDLLTRVPAVAWTARCASGTVYAQVNATSPSELLTMLNEQVRPLPGVRAVGTNFLLRGISRSAGTGASGQARTFEFVGGSDAELDAADRIIVGALQRNGRTPFTELAVLTDLSVPAARQRYRRLVREGVITVEARPLAAFLGRPVGAHVSIRVSGSTAPLVELVSTIPEVTYVAECAGESDLLLEFACADDAALATCARRLDAFPGVESAVVDRFEDVRTVRFYF